MIRVAVLLFSLAVCLASASNYASLKNEFDAFVTKHGKQYSTQLEYLNRLAIYTDNVKKIERLNQESTGAVFAVNKFADLTAAEFKKMYLGYVPRNTTTAGTLSLTGAVPPASYDWATKDKITPVKDQGQCGSCWAFSATENIESVWMIAKGLTPANFKPLAPQQIVDCDTSDGGCNGGDTVTAFDYVVKAGGQEPEVDYPYRAVNQACHFARAKVEVTITGFKYATQTKNEAQMKEATATVAPLSICVDAEPWQFYNGGVMKKAQCGTSLDHCVQITAYDTAVNPPYWKVRNSWGADWGEKGFIRLEYGTNTCGVAEEATTAVV